MTTPLPISCLHWGSDGELALEDYLDLTMNLTCIDSDLKNTTSISDLAICKNLPRANVRQGLDKTVDMTCTNHHRRQRIGKVNLKKKGKS